MSISIIAAALLLVQVQTQAPTPAPATATPAPTASPEKKKCKTIGETGSRLGGKRECRTQAEWDRIAAETQQKAQSNMGR